MPHKPITTDKQIAALKPAEKLYEVAVADCPGLRVRVSPKKARSGAGTSFRAQRASKTFYYRYRKPKEVSADKVRGDLEKMVIGTYPNPMSLSDAREEWQRLRDVKKSHGLPKAYEARQRADNLDALTAKQQKQEKDDYTVAVLVSEFATYQSTKIRSWAEQERCLKKYGVPTLGDQAARNVRRGAVTEILDALRAEDKNVQANRVLAHLRAAYNWALEREKGGIEFNPCTGIKKAKETARERVLENAEIRRLFENLPDSALTAAEQDLLHFILLTGARLSEACEAASAEIDTRKKLWTIPAARTKNGREHRLPLSEQAADLVRRRKGSSAYLFPALTDPKRPVHSWRIHAPLKDALPVLKVLPFTPHDLRRTLASGIAALGAPRHVISKILNHTDQSVTAIYDRHTYEPEMREWLGKWADHLDTLKKPAAVTRLTLKGVPEAVQ